LEKQPGILKAYTRTQLTKGISGKDAVGQAVQLSFNPGRCGDVAAVLKPFYVPAFTLSTGTTHGSPHAYDTHVPLLFYGAGIQPGVHENRVTPMMTAGVLSRLVGIRPPAKAQESLQPGITVDR